MIYAVADSLCAFLREQPGGFVVTGPEFHHGFGDYTGEVLTPDHWVLMQLRFQYERVLLDLVQTHKLQGHGYLPERRHSISLFYYDPTIFLQLIRCLRREHTISRVWQAWQLKHPGEPFPLRYLPRRRREPPPAGLS